MKVFITSEALAVPAGAAFLFFRGGRSALAFFLAQLVVALDIALIAELSGMIFESGEPKFANLSLVLLLKLLLLIFGLYGILTFFYTEPLALFTGLSVPIGVSVFWGVFLARSG